MKSGQLCRTSINFFYINQYCFKSSVNRHTMVNFQKEFGDLSTWKKMILFLQRQMTKQSHPHHVRSVLLWVHNSYHYLCLLTAQVQPKLTVENPGQSILVDYLWILQLRYSKYIHILSKDIHLTIQNCLFFIKDTQ